MSSNLMKLFFEIVEPYGTFYVNAHSVMNSTKTRHLASGKTNVVADGTEIVQ